MNVMERGGTGGDVRSQGETTCCIFTLDFDGTDHYRKSVQINGVPLRLWVNCVNCDDSSQFTLKRG